MIILGIDPGIARVGWGVVDASTHQPKTIDYGCITTKKSDNHSIRLVQIHTQIQDLLKNHKPNAVCVEDLYFATNAKTAITVGQARGVVLLACAQKNIEVVSYSPLAIKKTICGSGKADKKQIERMVVSILNLKETPKPDDTADALAIALTHAFSYKMKERTK